MLSIIIVSYDSDDFLNDCLDSIFKYNDIGDELEVFVVDNASSYKTKSIIYGYKRVVYVKNNNTGFGAGNNIGALRAKNEYLLFLNPDTVLLEPVFSFAVNQFRANRQLRAFGMLLVDENGRWQETFGFFPEKIKILPEKFYLPLIKLGYTPSKVFPWGANLFVRRKDFMEAGMFDENIFMCYEEPDLLHRLPKGTVKIFPKKIMHKAGHSNANLSGRYEVALRSEKYYFSKYGYSYKRYVVIHMLKLFMLMSIKKVFLIDYENERVLLGLYKESMER